VLFRSAICVLNEFDAREPEVDIVTRLTPNETSMSQWILLLYKASILQDLNATVDIVTIRGFHPLRLQYRTTIKHNMRDSLVISSSHSGVRSRDALYMIWAHQACYPFAVGQLVSASAAG